MKVARWCVDCGIMIGLVDPKINRCAACRKTQHDAMRKLREKKRYARWCVDCGVMLGLVHENTKRCNGCKKKRHNALNTQSYARRGRPKKEFVDKYAGLTRYEKVKKASDDWYRNKVTGYLDYHIGEERWDKYIKEDEDD